MNAFLQSFGCADHEFVTTLSEIGEYPKAG